MALPPGQRAVPGLPRFGTHLHLPPPPVPAAPALAVRGAVREPSVLAAAQLAALPRRELTADLHCVAGWSATGLRWGGVGFPDLYRTLLAPAVRPGAAVNHLVLGALDGYQCVVALEDALADDVLVADHLDGRPLDPDQGAPLRFVSPSQYGYVSVKHLCRLELHEREPRLNFGHASRLAAAMMARPIFARHPRSRVQHEERNAVLPNAVIRPVYRAFIPVIRSLSARGSTKRRSGARR